MTSRDHINRIAKEFIANKERTRSFAEKRPDQTLTAFQKALRAEARRSGYLWSFVDYRDGKTVMIIRQ
jgi:hypothetical protein